MKPLRRLALTVVIVGGLAAPAAGGQDALPDGVFAPLDGARTLVLLADLSASSAGLLERPLRPILHAALDHVLGADAPPAVALVAFDARVEVRLPLTPLNAEGEAAARAAIDALGPVGDHADAASALLAACQLVQGAPEPHAALLVSAGTADFWNGAVADDAAAAATDAAAFFRAHCARLMVYDMSDPGGGDPQVRVFLQGLASPDAFAHTQRPAVVAMLDEPDMPNYAAGVLSNSAWRLWEATQTRGIAADVVKSADLLAGALDGYRALVLADNALPEFLMGTVRAWWEAGGHLIVVDSGITSLLYLDPWKLGTREKNADWGILREMWGYYSSDHVVIETEHPITAGHVPGDVLPAVKQNALLNPDVLPPEAVVLASDPVTGWAAAVHYAGAGRITFVGPSSDCECLLDLIVNAMAL